MIVLMDKSKNLLITSRKYIYENETQVDQIKFYIPHFYEDLDVSKFYCVLTIRNANDEVYKRELEQIPSDKEDFICYKTAIDGDVTAYDGIVTIKLLFTSYVGGYVLKSNSLTFSVNNEDDNELPSYFIYYGTSKPRDSYDTYFVNSLDFVKRYKKNGTYAQEVSDGDYMFISYPVELGSIKFFKINGFYVDVVSCGTVAVTTPDGEIMEYYLYRTTQHSLGETSIIIDDDCAGEAFHYIYYGVSELRDEYDSDFVNSFEYVENPDKAGRYSKKAEKGEYVFISYPSILGELEYFKINGLYVDAVNCGEIQVTTPNSSVQSYYLYRTTQPSLGNVTIIIE